MSVSTAARVQNSRLVIDQMIALLADTREQLAVYQATTDPQRLSSALESVMKLDDLEADLFRDVRLAERQARRA